MVGIVKDYFNDQHESWIVTLLQAGHVDTLQEPCLGSLARAL